MIKVEKNIGIVPKCLESNKAYNCDDVKRELRLVYNSKCCYCETKLTKNYEIEHFRPQSEYKWLKNSWSNLLFVCSSCNKSKGNRFEVSSTKITEKPENIDIHNSAAFLNEFEKPFFLHPEYDEIENFVCFEKGGKIISKNDNQRANYTIKHTNLNHADLVKERYEIIVQFINKSKNNLLKEELKKTINEFTKDAHNKELSFTAFRKYIVKHHLTEILKDVLIK